MPQEPVSPTIVRSDDEYRQLEVQHHEYEGRLGELAMPVLLAWGRLDPMSSVADARSLLVGLRHGDMVVFDHSAHVPYLEEPDAFAAVVESFARMGSRREATS